jgi:hypothetical protein
MVSYSDAALHISAPYSYKAITNDEEEEEDCVSYSRYSCYFPTFNFNNLGQQYLPEHLLLLNNKVLISLISERLPGQHFP